MMTIATSTGRPNIFCFGLEAGNVVVILTAAFCYRRDRCDTGVGSGGVVCED